MDRWILGACAVALVGSCSPGADPQANNVQPEVLGNSVYPEEADSSLNTAVSTATDTAEASCVSQVADSFYGVHGSQVLRGLDMSTCPDELRSAVNRYHQTSSDHDTAGQALDRFLETYGQAFRDQVTAAIEDLQGRRTLPLSEQPMTRWNAEKEQRVEEMRDLIDRYRAARRQLVSVLASYGRPEPPPASPSSDNAGNAQ